MQALSQGQYKDTFITITLSAGEDIHAGSQLGRNFGEIIFKHYRKWIPNLTRADGTAIKGDMHRWATVAQRAVKASKVLL